MSASGVTALLAFGLLAPASPPEPPPLALGHCWIVVTTGAPERQALEKAGFRIAPTVNRHDGQGTASITIEFVNGFLELMYPDPSVPVSPGLEAAAEKFRLKSAWRESGYSPLGIVFDRTPSTPASFPFATWKVTAEMPRAVSLSISSHPRTPERDNEALAKHPNGTHRLTAVRVTAPAADRLPPAASYVGNLGLVSFDTGDAWRLEVTLDAGKQCVTRDFRPDLLLVVHY